MGDFDRRGFLKSAGLAGLAMAPQPATAAPLTEKEKLDRIASNTWPIRYIFKSRMGFMANTRSAEMKAKYGEITMLDFPRFSKEHFPGVTRMDLFSGLFGDVTDDSMYVDGAGLRGHADARHPGVRPLQRFRQAMAGKNGGADGGHRHALPAHLQQRPARYLRTGCGQAQGRYRGSQEVAGWRGHAGGEVDARQQRRAAHSPRPVGDDRLPQSR